MAKIQVICTVKTEMNDEYQYYSKCDEVKGIGLYSTILRCSSYYNEERHTEDYCDWEDIYLNEFSKVEICADDTEA